MKNFLKNAFQKPWYPLLLSAYPVLALFGNNVNEARPDVIVRPLLVFLAGALVLILLFRLLLRDWHRAAFASCMWIILFATYGHLINYLIDKEIDIPSHYILSLWLVLAEFFLWLASRLRIKFFQATVSLNLIAAFLLVYPLYQITSYSVGNNLSAWQVHAASVAQQPDPATLDRLPDIYYIILDSYGRADLLQQAYQYDNTAFVSKLEEMGFYVANCSQSNYMRTDIALTSTLNMDYLQNLSDKFKPDTYNRTRLFELLKHSSLRKTLEGVGYETIAYATGFFWSELDDADVFLAPSPIWTDLTEFEKLLLNSTLARLLDEAGKINTYQISSNHYRERTSFVLDSIPKLVKLPGPKFVFMHIISPHPPFVFGPDGQPTDAETFLNADKKLPAKMYAIGYTNQVTYLNTRMEQVLDMLIHASDTPPVIILQGDHGPWMQPENKRLWILNAYYLPGHNNELYPTISPVNSFRIVLNDYLGTNYALLEDKSYFSPIPYIYDFKPNSNPCIP
ncbi:MAG: hypothetical protein A2X25_06690 [Chloroflexi bacterium GWB2_49_20]|nr:MAG: hypothetical protein A2X25_06690 [Chloroflexi bacterium GWB2_49_20]OGN80274.1 MAG: hypothetical protein A2X26_08090 [Chloroflexi bacterium GWC2_49_37]OGN86086.1 MAG: hypothetical protein A2X27_00655 [Chloroflexi bacterium GWD2_49_16]HCC79390.1 hypothetical protein [Anaerolineae bacterium]HCM96389.1 hypothetical protein [Anaerolineae bacterium]